MIFNRTKTITLDGKKYTNNLTKTIITCDGEKISDYCILAVEGNIVTIKQGGMVTQVGLESNPYKNIITELCKPTPKKNTKKTDTKEEPKKKTAKKTTSKTTIKGTTKKSDKK